jgi:hypothetical protein
MSTEIDWAALAAEARRKIAQWQASLELAEEMLAASGVSIANGERSSDGQYIAKGAFLGMNIPDAAKKYLESVRSDQTVRQITEALEQGGLRNLNTKAIYTALWRKRSPDGEFAQPTENTWGLAEWYRNSPAVKRRPKSTKIQEAVISDGATGRLRETAPPPSTQGGGVTILDATEKLLRDEGKPLHATVIVARLGDMGKTTNVKSIAGTLPQDSKKRFENLGANTWAITEWPESIKEPYRKQNKKEATLPL